MNSTSRFNDLDLDDLDSEDYDSICPIPFFIHLIQKTIDKLDQFPDRLSAIKVTFEAHLASAEREIKAVGSAVDISDYYLSARGSGIAEEDFESALEASTNTKEALSQLENALTEIRTDLLSKLNVLEEEFIPNPRWMALRNTTIGAEVDESPEFNKAFGRLWNDISDIHDKLDGQIRGKFEFDDEFWRYIVDLSAVADDIEMQVKDDDVVGIIRSDLENSFECPSCAHVFNIPTEAQVKKIMEKAIKDLDVCQEKRKEISDGDSVE
ncbi:hypothetical protein BT96DRAFT_978091 [Gymnopus androsaceus JB14]|uniref:Uncharacterized protein n=1 Tax=Gymnopus androsaceus JB14 TaxID=1447944 RepID=A0A6A4HBX5_9AGAR|nr:hypothetical protein BT96DRAFT_978091 [Gymnopus androsaceus JB14]